MPSIMPIVFSFQQSMQQSTFRNLNSDLVELDLVELNLAQVSQLELDLAQVSQV